MGLKSNPSQTRHTRHRLPIKDMKTFTQADIDFLTAWRRTHGANPVRARLLLPLAQAAGLCTRAECAPHRQIGAWLSRRRNATIHTSAGSFQIKAAGIRDGYQRWALESLPTTDNSKENQ